jgi:hypothetical protein
MLARYTCSSGLSTGDDDHWAKLTTCAEGGVLEEGAPFPPEDERHRRGEQDNVGERDRLRERRQPVTDTVAGPIL